MQCHSLPQSIFLTYFGRDHQNKLWSLVLQQYSDLAVLNCRPWTCTYSTSFMNWITWSPAWPSSTAFRADLSTRIAVGLFLRIARHHVIVSRSKFSIWKREILTNGKVRDQQGIKRRCRGILGRIGTFLRTWSTPQTHWYNSVDKSHFLCFLGRVKPC